MAQQHTLSTTICFSGVGLHTGEPTRLEIRPAEAGAGLVFTNGKSFLPARAEFVFSCERSTSLSNGDFCVRTVEHLLAALNGMGVDNAEIFVDGREIPILDGSALCFAEEIRKTGLRIQDAPAMSSRIMKPILVSEGDGYLTALPAEGFRITCLSDYGRPHAGPQIADLVLDAETFLRKIAPARTFGFQEEVDALLARGLALGGSLDNALVISDAGPSRPFRVPDELASHKALDLIGDLSLCGKRLTGHFIGFKLSHRLNVMMAKQIGEGMVDHL